MKMKNAVARHANSQTTNNVRLHVEESYNGKLTSKCSAILPGQYAIHLTNPPQMTHRLMNTFCAKGVVLLYPENATDYSDLDQFRTTDGAINLSAVYLAKEMPEDMPEESWIAYQDKLKSIFKVLRSDCISPMQRTVADAQRLLGYGAPKIHKKFGGDIESQQETNVDVIEVMNKLLEQFNAETANV
jgi:hypothetical protein